MKIVFVTNNYKPYSGGVVSSIDTFTHELKQLGHTVYIITLDFEKNLPAQEHIIRVFCPIKFSYKLKPIAIPLIPNKQVLDIIKKLNPDIIHSHHPFLLGTSALKAAKKLNKPLVFTHHTMYQEYVHNIPMPEQITKPLAKKLSLNYCKQANLIIAPSISTKNYLQENDITNHIQVLPSGVAHLFFQQKQQGSIEKKINLLSVSRFTKEKNIEFLLRTCALLNQDEYALTLVGYGPQLPQLQALSEDLGIVAQVEFIIAPSKQTLAQCYQQADIFIFASTTETQGIVLAEAMASGLPIIAVKAPGSQDIIQHNANGFLIEKEKEMAAIIYELAKKPSLYQKISENAFKTAQDYSGATITHHLVHYYQQLLNSINAI